MGSRVFNFDVKPVDGVEVPLMASVVKRYYASKSDESDGENGENGRNDKVDWRHSDLLVSLLAAHPYTLSAEVELVAHQMADSHETSLYSLRPDLIYERWFYPDLLAMIRQTERTILVGSPGIGKSHFQFYYLMRLLKTTHQTEHPTDPLPADIFGSCKPARYVFRLEGEKFTVYDLVELLEYRRVGLSPGEAATFIADAMATYKASNCLYFFEPESTHAAISYAGLHLPILATVSPDIVRYKEFNKNGGAKVFLPTYRLDELQALGAYLLSEKDVKADSELGQAYSSTEIAARFHQFGGIFRHVLPCNMDALTLCRTSQIEAIQCAISSNTYKPANIEIGEGSHYLSKYAVKEIGQTIEHKLPTFNFKAVVYDYVSAHVKEELTAPMRYDE